MRFCAKYSLRSRFHIFPFFLKLRILNFNRPKWKKLQSQIHYFLKQQKLNKKKRIFISYLRFVANLKTLRRNFSLIKKKTRSNFIYLKFLKFFKKVKFFLKSKKFKNLKFKHSKLVFNHLTQKKFYKFKTRQFYKRFFFFNLAVIKKNLKLPYKTRFYFKNLLLMKHHIVKYSLGYFSLKNFRKLLFNNLKVLNHNNMISKFILKPEYRIDILLYRLKFFSTPSFARFACKKKQIKLHNFFKPSLNNSIFNKFINQGDILFFSGKYNYSYNLNLYARSFFLPSFIEVDYYSNTLIFLKNLNDLNYKDISTLLKEPLCIYKFRDYLLK